MAYDSKYTGAEVEALLDRVDQGTFDVSLPSSDDIRTNLSKYFSTGTNYILSVEAVDYVKTTYSLRVRFIASIASGDIYPVLRYNSSPSTVINVPLVMNMVVEETDGDETAVNNFGNCIFFELVLPYFEGTFYEINTKYSLLPDNEDPADEGGDEPHEEG